MDETIVALATPPGRGAIAIVRASGTGVAGLAARMVPSRRLRPHVAHHVEIVDETGHAIDRGLVLFSPAPHSYTGEDTVEFHIHGSPVVAREVIRAALAIGARLAEPGEFTRRAFLLGKIDLHAAAAVADLIDAESRSAARAALANLAGGLSNAVAAVRARIARTLEELSASIDFPDEVAEPDRAQLDADLRTSEEALRRLRNDGEVGRLVREGLSVAIVGPPNAGKSSLLNALLGEERALVSEIAGTTRDTIEESLTIDGVQVRLVDTAGIRAHADRLEAAGIERSRRALASARVAVVVVDGSAPLDEHARALLAETAGRPRVLFANKADLGTVDVRPFAESGAIVGSVRDSQTLSEIRRALAQAGWGGEAPDLERPHLVSALEFDSVNAALHSLELARETLAGGFPCDLVAGDLQRSYASLGRLTGDAANEAILEGVFARFCIGK